MTIEIVWGTGEGVTPLSAFDAALADGGIHNYNLVELSSIIPPDTAIAETERHDQTWEVGDLVATVLAANKSAVAGKTVSAGLGWAIADEGGIFYEASAQDSRTVGRLLRRGLRDGRQQRDSWSWEIECETRIVEHTVEQNGAAIVAALYEPL